MPSLSTPDFPFLLPSLAAVAALAVVHYFVVVRLFFPTRKDGRELPPKCRQGFWEVLQNFFGYDAPFFLLKMVREVGCKYMRLPLALPGQPHFVVVGDYKVARQVLLDSKSLKWLVPKQNFDLVTQGDNFAFAEGHRYRHSRKAVAPAFGSMHSDRMRQIIQKCLDSWMAKTDLTKPFDVGEEMQRVTVNVISQFGFDYELSKDDVETVLRSLRLSFDEFVSKTPRNPLRRYFGWAFAEVREARRASTDMLAICRKVIQVHREKKSQGTATASTLIANLVEDEDYTSDQERARDMLIYFIAGYDTTAYTLSFCLLELARHPQVQRDLRKELQSCQSLEEAMRCPGLQRVVRESMRLYPAAAIGSLRVAAQDILLPNNMVIPKESVCLLTYLIIHHDESVFEESPDSFLPERWENPTKAQQEALMPFSLGRRNCVGQALATTELYLMLAQLCAQYEFDVLQEGKMEFFLTLKTVGTLLTAKKDSTAIS